MTLEEALASARLTFPAFPSEVFELWLDDRIRQKGWPPTGFEWQGFLFGRSIRDWQSFAWRREQLELSFQDLSETARNMVTCLIDAGALGKNNVMSIYIPNTKQRFASIVDHMKERHCLPGTIVLLRSIEGIDIVEGNHRVAARLALPLLGAPYNELSIERAEAWVAIEPVGTRSGI